jgi:hypothetical protein
MTSPPFKLNKAQPPPPGGVSQLATQKNKFNQICRKHGKKAIIIEFKVIHKEETG